MWLYRLSSLACAQLYARLSLQLALLSARLEQGSWLSFRRGSALQLARLSARLSIAAAGSALSAARESDRGSKRGDSDGCLEVFSPLWVSCLGKTKLSQNGVPGSGDHLIHMVVDTFRQCICK